ncbi:MAG: MFS transporter [Clostridia bacterium]|nr:MFS transporter [Clostridia bacterium]
MNTAERPSRRSWLVLILFGLVGQIAWSVENMYFNLFVFDEVSPNLDAITLMVQLSGVVATLVTLVAGTLSDKTGNRRRFISVGYLIWGVTVALFGFLSPELVGKILGLEGSRAVAAALTAVIVGDCVMTLFGSTANDAAFNAWVTDNTRPAYRGRVEGVLAVLPLFAMLIVAGGFGILVSALGYSTVFLILGVTISASGALGLFLIRDSDELARHGSLRDLFFGFYPRVVRANLPLYVAFLIILGYGVACQIFMPYLIIYMKTYLGFSVLEYSAVFAVAIIAGAAINIYLGALSDRKEKTTLLYIAAAIMSAGLIAMYFCRGMSHIATLLLFGVFGFVMITGYIFVSALSGSIVRDFTPPADTGKLQGVRMVFAVLIPMILGPAIGNAINRAAGIPLADAGADAMTTSYIPAPEIFLAAGLVILLVMALIPILKRAVVRSQNEVTAVDED